VANAPLKGIPLVAYIVTRARQLGLDPAAVLSIAVHEGGFSGAIGDNGTSFGPFQLHIGGALPAGIAAQGGTAASNWANSPAGLDYALGRINTVAHGQTGTQAITSIASRFERPANPGAEISLASQSYPGIAASVAKGNFAGVSGQNPGTVPTDASGNVTLSPSGLDSVLNSGPIHTVGDFLGKLTDPNFWLRVLQIIGGAGLTFAGVVLLARQVGLASVSAPAPVAALAGAVE
jgi:hypothetical protein